ncbi:DNA-binding protein [Parafrankia sp. FMc2]|uniref:DNA-binding protein n=1 Tax=Parafrankia sp. FMc2 TaxID=3233196 RepID=UPI0034D7B87C
MKLPTLLDYQQAVQIPRLAFLDERLRDSVPRLNPLGMPAVATGGFALTFDVSRAGRRYAVRCFHRHSDNLELRYACIADFVRSASLDFLVGVDYLPAGIRVRDRAWPIVRMEWIDGARLDDWVQENLDRPSRLDRARLSLNTAVAELRRRGAAHGDLQHGNILVLPDASIRLVDYDGMYLPALGSLGASERGHRNYQHPDRSNQYDVTLDRFAQEVIAVSLAALARDPYLWREFNTGENLLLSAADFADPSASALFARLEQMPGVAAAARRLRDACLVDYEDAAAILDAEAHVHYEGAGAGGRAGGWHGSPGRAPGVPAAWQGPPAPPPVFGPHGLPRAPAVPRPPGVVRPHAVPRPRPRGVPGPLAAPAAPAAAPTPATPAAPAGVPAASAPPAAPAPGVPVSAVPAAPAMSAVPVAAGPAASAVGVVSTVSAARYLRTRPLRPAPVVVPAPTVLSARDRAGLLARRAEEVMVVGRIQGVRQVRRTGTVTILDFGNPRGGSLKAIAWDRVSRELTASHGDLAALAGVWVRIVGQIVVDDRGDLADEYGGWIPPGMGMGPAGSRAPAGSSGPAGSGAAGGSRAQGGSRAASSADLTRTARAPRSPRIELRRGSLLRVLTEREAESLLNRPGSVPAAPATRAAYGSGPVLPPRRRLPPPVPGPVGPKPGRWPGWS